MHLPASRHLAFAALVLGVVLVASTHVQAQDCGGGSSDPGNSGDPFGNGNGDNSSTDISGFTDMNNQNWDNTMTAWDFFAQGATGDASAPAPDPVNVSIDTATTVYAESPTSVSSTAWTNSTPISLHSIEYINTDGSDGGLWHLDIAGGAGTSDPRSVGVTFPSPGTYYVRSGASTDGGNTWTYSDQVTVTANDPITSHTVTIQTKPKAEMEKWFVPSNTVSKTFQVKHTNPYP